MPPLHSPKVGAIVPSVSMKACSRKPAGWACQTRWRVALSASSSASMAPWSKRRVKSPLVVGSGIRWAPKPSRKASSLRRNAVSSSRWPPNRAL
jgi:hypothetical protein